MTRWEYLVASEEWSEDDARMVRLDELGAEGWELVTATYDRESAETVLYLKRPLSEMVTTVQELRGGDDG